MNTIAITGNLCHNIELRYSKNNKAVLTNTIAVRQNKKNKDGQYETDFIDIVAFSNNAEFIGKYAKKGNKVGIQGKLHINNYTDEKGITHKNSYIVVDNVEILTSNKEETPKQNIEITEDMFPF